MAQKDGAKIAGVAASLPTLVALLRTDPAKQNVKQAAQVGCWKRPSHGPVVSLCATHASYGVWRSSNVVVCCVSPSALHGPDESNFVAVQAHSTARTRLKAHTCSPWAPPAKTFAALYALTPAPPLSESNMHSARMPCHPLPP